MIRTMIAVVLGLMPGLASQAAAQPAATSPPAPGKPAGKEAAILQAYVETFNKHDNELYTNAFPNKKAVEFLQGNIPLFDCPDEDIRRTYYFRWWTFRKHIKQTPEGWVITEFLPQVTWSGLHNTIDCPAGHHFREGRWLHDRKYLDDYGVFWFRKGGSVRSYSFWAADSIWSQFLVTGNDQPIKELLPDLIKNYEEWEKEKRDPNGLFWQIDDRDGMEISIGGSGYRATINSYMYGDAVAITKMAGRMGNKEVSEKFRAKAIEIRKLTQEKLWDEKAGFFKVLPRGEGKQLADVREEHGFTPWYFHLPEPNKGYEVAWKQLMDPQGFYAPYGPTSAERRHPGFKLSHQSPSCQWNGPSWPFATAVTLTAMANVLNDYPQNVITKADYLDILRMYARSQQRKLEDGTMVPWIDENLDPLTGDWVTRDVILDEEARRKKEGQPIGLVERGKDYNHSTFCDLVITGLVGLHPRSDDIIEVNPLVPENKWDSFCLDDVLYHGRSLTILWDKTGTKYGRGAGLSVLVDGKLIAHGVKLGKLTGKLTEIVRNSTTHPAP